MPGLGLTMPAGRGDFGARLGMTAAHYRHPERPDGFDRGAKDLSSWVGRQVQKQLPRPFGPSRQGGSAALRMTRARAVAGEASGVSP